MTEKKGEPVAKVIARCGYCSRREAEKLIQDGKVKVNGVVIDTPLVFITDQSIKINNKLLQQPEKTQLWMFHKPRGYIVSNNDPENRKTIYSILPSTLPRVVPVGRLDMDTEGLLLLTNDGKLANFISHPSTAWTRQYRVKVHGFWKDIDFSKYEKKGITINGIHYAPFKVSVEKETDSTNVWLKISVVEGRNREVRNIMENFNLKVMKLVRISFGQFHLGSLPVGEVKPITGSALKNAIGNKFNI